MQVYIYALVDPRTDGVRYIGWTKNPARRLKQHISRARLHEEDTYKARWIRSLLALGLEPTMTILVVTDAEHHADVEREQIALHRAAGAYLTNCSLGGDGLLGRIVSEETRQKISIAKKGRSRDLDSIRRSVEGRYTPEAIARSKARAQEPEAQERKRLRYEKTRRTQLERRVNAKLDDDQVRSIRQMYENGLADQPTLARLFGVSQPTVCRAIRRKSYPQVQEEQSTYTWRL